MTQKERIAALETRVGELEEQVMKIAALKVKWRPGVGGVFMVQRKDCPLDRLKGMSS